MWLKTGNAQAIPQSSSLLESEQCFVIVKFAQQLLQEFLLGPGDAEKSFILFFFPLFYWKYNFLTPIWAELPTKALCRAR